jgi:hypothetical protein
MLLSILVVFAFALVVCALLFRALLRRGATADVDPLEWLEEFSSARYGPMERLLASEDYTFLATQPGYTKSIARRLRKQRVGIFQSYLASMIRDFHRLTRIARVAAAYATEDQSGFEAALWRLRFGFYWSVIGVEAHLALNIVGLAQVDARRLVSGLERVRVYTMHMAPVAQ